MKSTIAIIGAGLSGLSAAHLLKDFADIILFEKARGVSGRMSTRRAGPYFFDHGAQYFTARTQPFKDFIQPLLKQGIIQQWNARYAKFQGTTCIIERRGWLDDEQKYVGVTGMNQVAKSLAKALHIHFNTRIVSLKHQGKWQLTDEQGQQYSGFDWVICTAPSPQAAELLPAFFKYHANIKAIKMRACFALMLGFQKTLPTVFDAAHVIDSDVSWIAVNSHKPRRPDLFTLIVHSSEEYAEAHIDGNHDQVMQHLIGETSRTIKCDASRADYTAIHAWRYANNEYKKQQSSPFIDHGLKLAACGDWCLGGSVEGAFTSAYELTKHMKERAL